MFLLKVSFACSVKFGWALESFSHYHSSSVSPGLHVKTGHHRSTHAVNWKIQECIDDFRVSDTRLTPCTAAGHCWCVCFSGQKRVEWCSGCSGVQRSGHQSLAGSRSSGGHHLSAVLRLQVRLLSFSLRQSVPARSDTLLCCFSAKNWNTPLIFDLKEGTVSLIVQAERWESSSALSLFHRFTLNTADGFTQKHQYIRHLADISLLSFTHQTVVINTYNCVI